MQYKTHLHAIFINDAVSQNYIDDKQSDRK